MTAETLSNQPTLTPEGRAALDAFTDSAPTRGVPAWFSGLTTSESIIYEHQAGYIDYSKRDDDAAGAERVKADTTLHLFSQSKFVTSLAVLQLVEKGLLDYDDEQLVSKYMPELSTDKLQILEGYDEESGKAKYRKPTKAITLRHLVTHTSGLAYYFVSPNIQKWRDENGKKEALGPGIGIEGWLQPLLAEPGSIWLYSTGLAMAGELVARATGQSLEDYFQENIFKPCGMTLTSFYPKPEIRERLMEHAVRAAPGTKELMIPHKYPLSKPEDPKKMAFEAGGEGLYGTVHDFLLLLQNVLKCSPLNPNPPANPLISPKGFNMLFESAIPAHTKRGLVGFLAAGNESIPPATEENVDHSIALCINLEDSGRGRRAGSGAWGGMARTHFWLDPKTGIAACCGTQLLAGHPDVESELFREFERTLYDGLKK